MDLTECPQCGLPAEIEQRFTLGSTDGPMEHVKVRCVQRHWFLCSVATLAACRRLAVQPAVP